MDPAHVPISHHGITGSRYTNAKPVELETLRSLTTHGGFSFDILGQDGQPSAINDFRPPALQQITTNFPGGG